MMEIILVRHGKPVGATNPKLSASGFADWVLNYDASEVDIDSLPPENLKQAIRSHFIVSSHLARAIDSAKVCLNLAPHLIDNALREMEIPSYRLPFKLKAYTWLVLNRLLWFMGIKGDVESFKAAKIRANDAAKMLIALATEHHQVAVFGHGLMNKSIAKELERLGWTLSSQGHSYWSSFKLQRTN